MKLFGSKGGSLIGLDIGTHYIKLVELAGDARAPKVISWGVAPTPVNGFNENAITDVDMIADALNGLLIQAGSKGSEVAVAISASHAITKVLSMPADINEQELEEQVSIEALHFVPYPIDEVNIDFEVLGPSATGKEENDVLLVACRRTIIDDYIDLIEASDLTLKYVDIDTYALERVFRNQKQLRATSKKPVALFDIGSSSSHLMVLDDNRVLYSRHQNFGGARLIKQIRKEYGVNAQEAEGILKSAQLPSDFSSAVQDPFVDQLEQEIQRSLQFFYSSSSHASVDSVVLSGMCAGLDGLASDLQMRIRDKVSILNPIAQSRVMSGRLAIDKQMAALSTAFGLSLRGL